MVNSWWMSWQIDYLLYLQNLREVSHHIFDRFFLIITMFGEITIPIIIITLFYWVLNKRAGQLMLWSYIFGFILNFAAKITACIYRPWILDTRIKPVPEAIPAATGYSFPSGHTAGVMSVWGSLALSFWNNKFVRYISIAIIFLVMFSRNYLGVHTPQDVIVSFVLSCFVIWGANRLIDWENKGKNRDLIITLSLFVLTVLVLVYSFVKGYPIQYLFGKVLYDPASVKISMLCHSGFLFGAFAGWIFEKRYVDFQPQAGSVIKKIIRFAIGMLILFGIDSTIKNLQLGICVQFIQYSILGLFVTFIYPFMVKKFNL